VTQFGGGMKYKIWIVLQAAWA